MQCKWSGEMGTVAERFEMQLVIDQSDRRITNSPAAPQDSS